MNIRVNGQTRAVEPEMSLRQLMSEVSGRELDASGAPVDGRRLGIAVAVNSEVVPRSRWTGTELDNGDEVEIVKAVQGG